ncbi:hypothetical protein MAR_021356 [Mya arenaria]|uniref:Apextrin C-terminal domain-containing protein n=1 Tax=Mya arenaria TaxID=6604 RepID=A0ABY7EAM4_MYAAR|nr:hypothetical protein MAR_021356 [Mya arenaria]
MKMWSTIVCSCMWIAVSQAATLPEALHYVGVGYNMLKGNPDGDFWARGGDDPGLLSTRKVLSLSRTNNDALKTVAFTQSFKAIQQQTGQDSYVFQDDQTTCTSGAARYKLALSQANHYGVTDEFAADVCSLPLQYNQQVYFNFLNTWGTSSRDVTNGGACLNYNSSLVVDLNAFRYRQQYRNVVGVLQDTLTLGSEANPEPIGYTLVVISDMLNSSHWLAIDDLKTRGLCPPSSEAALTYWSTNLERAITELPGYLGAGTYSLAQPKSGCPTGEFTWYEGWRLQDTETQTPDNAWSINNNFAGKLMAGEMQLEYCTKGESEPTDFDRNWPAGDYCIFKYGSCPADFAEGFVKWDDEDSMNRNDWQGVLPDGTYDEDTLQRFCCRSDGMPTEAIVLPTDTPFYLFQYKRDVCQKVVNMNVAEQFIRWDDEDFKTPSDSEIGTVHPGMQYWNKATGESGSEIYYCYYSPQI